VSSVNVIGLDTVVARNEEPVAVEVDRTIVMMSIDQGMYFGLQGTGSKIWSLLEQPRAVTDVCVALVNEFDIDPVDCQREVLGFLEELRTAQLIRVHDEAAGPVRTMPDD
jgi:hypothetical protein